MASSNRLDSSRPAGHRWKFFRAGGFDQVLLETGADLMALETLDQKLWVALSCPVRGIEFDTKTLEFVDSDGDGHIRPPEVLAAVRWAVNARAKINIPFGASLTAVARLPGNSERSMTDPFAEKKRPWGLYLFLLALAASLLLLWRAGYFPGWFGK